MGDVILERKHGGVRIGFTRVYRLLLGKPVMRVEEKSPGNPPKWLVLAGLLNTGASVIGSDQVGELSVTYFAANSDREHLSGTHPYTYTLVAENYDGGVTMHEELVVLMGSYATDTIIDGFKSLGYELVLSE